MRLIVVANPFLELGGGAGRAFKVITSYANHGVEPILFIPYNGLYGAVLAKIRIGLVSEKAILNEFDKIFNCLSTKGVIIPSSVWDLLERVLDEVEADFRRRVTIHKLLKIRKVEYEASNKYLEDIKAFKVDFVYSLHETIDAVIMASYVASKISKPFGILLQLEPYYENLKTMFRFLSMERWSIHRLSIKYLLASYTNTYVKKIYLNNVIRSSKLRFIASVSEAPFIVSGLRKHCRHIRLLHPANAYGNELIKYRSSTKDDYAIFSARLTCEKGVLEIPYIWRKVVSKLPNAKLIITGILSKQKVKTEFERLLEKFNLNRNVEYLGYVKR
ncbi:MAG: glycosyltransferase [Candidatus Methanomethylicia archaeon]